jgi:hypothetical protein
MSIFLPYTTLSEEYKPESALSLVPCGEGDFLRPARLHHGSGVDSIQGMGVFYPAATGSPPVLSPAEMPEQGKGRDPKREARKELYPLNGNDVLCLLELRIAGYYRCGQGKGGVGDETIGV